MYDPRKDFRVHDLVEVSHQVARERIEDLKRSHHPTMADEIVRWEMERHEDRVQAIKRFFFEKVTGHPF